MSPPEHPGLRYELRLDGHLDDRWSAWFDGPTVSREEGGTTTLRGAVTDQAGLHGLLARVRDIGATLVSVRVVEPDGPGRMSAMTDSLPDLPAEKLTRRPLEELTWPARTERLTLRPATPDDLEATWCYRRLDSVNRWLTQAPADLEAYGARFLEPGRLAKALVVQLGDDVIGDLMLDVHDAWAQTEVADRAGGVQAEVGWAFHPDQAGRGYATEAVRELLRISFEGLGLRRVTANCFADNTASSRLMERLGMRREAHAVADALHRSREWVDSLAYALLASEWRHTA
jgi:RimJ/RimL family protein N-acetyltransferase